MKLPTLYMYMGLPGSGKTYLAKRAAKPDDLVLDSNEIREEVWGDPSIQNDPAHIFNIMYQRTCAALKEERSVFYVATNISMKRRIALLKQLKKRFPDVIYRCVCVIAPLDVCHRRNGARERIVPAEVIDRMARQFDPPCENEGWNAIDISYNFYNDDTVILNGGWKAYRTYYIQKVKEFGSQCNSHHSLSLFDHCNECARKAIMDGASRDVCRAADIHDFGKLYTQVYWEKDNYREAHYPSHSELGSYLALVMGYPLHVAQLVRFHMVPYYDVAAQKTWCERIGEKLWNDVVRLHQYNEASH